MEVILKCVSCNKKEIGEDVPKEQPFCKECFSPMVLEGIEKIKVEAGDGD